jgi:uncharacterized CHY-type Zn-finger protein
MNMSMEIMFMFLGAILGTVLSIAVPFVYEKIKKTMIVRARTSRQNLLESGHAYDWLIRYYQSKDHLIDLYDCKIGNFEIKIPFLTKDSWNRFEKNLLKDENFMEYSETADQKFPIDNELIKKRILLNQRLFNEATLYLDRFQESGDAIKLYVKSCQYYQMFTLLASLEEETFRAIKKNKFNHTPIRDSMCSDLVRAQQIHKKPSSIGCQVALALRTPEGFELLIQTRSHATITYGGAKALIPVFGLSPIPGIEAPKNILLYNFIKEYCEELFNYEDLITLMASKRAEPFWFFELPEAKDILHLIENGDFIFEYLGFGFDALNGSSTLAMLVVINNVDFSQKLKTKIYANWEVHERSYEVEPIEFVDYHSAKFEEWLRQKKYQYGSAFAISRAIKRLDCYRSTLPENDRAFLARNVDE